MNQKINQTEWKKQSRRKFIIAGLSVFTGALGFWYAKNASVEDEVPWPFRRILGLNEKIWRAKYNTHSTDETPPAPAKGSEARVNSDIGIEKEIDLNNWALNVGKENFTLENLKAMPQVEKTEVFKCVEGWSNPISYRGISFNEFLKNLKIDYSNYEYVGLETPDGTYYVSIDMESMKHDKTVLALEMNGVSLSDEHGAPLRLIIPVKYGIKNLKRIGKIFFSNERPPDYWTEQGYDWYAGL